MEVLIYQRIYELLSEVKKINPWAVCTTSVGRNSSKYERCVKKIKRKVNETSTVNKARHREIKTRLLGPESMIRPAEIQGKKVNLPALAGEVRTGYDGISRESGPVQGPSITKDAKPVTGKHSIGYDYRGKMEVGSKRGVKSTFQGGRPERRKNKLKIKKTLLDRLTRLRKKREGRIP